MRVDVHALELGFECDGMLQEDTTFAELCKQETLRYLSTGITTWRRCIDVCAILPPIFKRPRVLRDAGVMQSTFNNKLVLHEVFLEGRQRRAGQ